jgi:hypothetical protein
MPSIVDNLSVRKVCVDDFAIMFMIFQAVQSLIRLAVQNLIFSVSNVAVMHPGHVYPNIKVISRDGAQIYANVSEKSHLGVVQVSDRCNIIMVWQREV